MSTSLQFSTNFKDSDNNGDSNVKLDSLMITEDLI